MRLAVSIFPRHLSALVLVAGLSPASAGIDSGGGPSSDGVVRNHCSIGSPFASIAARSGAASNQTGLVAVIRLLTPSSVTDFDPAADADRDGGSNLMEYLAGTDPNNAASVFRPQGDYAAGVFRMPIPTVSGRNYQIWASNDLKNWSLYRTLSGNGTVKIFEFDETTITSGPLFSSIHPTTYFFRIRISVVDFDPMADTDYDGSSDLMEYLAGTDPGNAASVFRPQGIYSGRVFRMPIPTISDRIYRVWVSRDLQDWTLYHTLSGNDASQLFEFDESAIPPGPLRSDGEPSKYFFRIQILTH